MCVMKITQQDIPNAFAPLELDLLHKGAAVTIDPAHPLLLTRANGRPVLGMRGMEVREGSGQKGFFEVRCISGCEYGITIGMATHDVDVTKELGCGHDGFGWWSVGDDSGHLIINHSLRRVSPDEGDDFPAYNHGYVDTPGFTVGDVIGLMLDCSGTPTLLFFVNGAQVQQIIMTTQVQGKMLFPAFALSGGGEIDISPNPDLPADAAV